MKNILVIEDNESIRQEIVDILRFEEYFVFEAENGAKGLEIANIFKLDLIICDIMMPVMDGYAVLTAIRQNPKISYVPFIFLSALGSKDDLIKGAILGSDNYLMKPFNSDELLEAVKRTFSIRLLIVENNLSLRSKLISILSTKNYFIFESDNWQKAFEVAEREIPDLIISEIQMYLRDDGLRLLDKIRRSPILSDTPFILISSSGSKEDLIRSSELGVNDVLIKPFNGNDLLELVEQNTKTLINRAHY